MRVAIVLVKRFLAAINENNTNNSGKENDCNRVDFSKDFDNNFELLK